MQKAKSSIVLFLFIITSIMSFQCTKDDDEINSGDPSDLTIEILSINHETGYVEIQANATNASLYQLFIEPSEIAVEDNETGYFEYTFDNQSEHVFSIRAYGSSGRYLKESRTITIADEPEVIPLNRGAYSPLAYDGYQLVWQDEFNGNNINTDNWSFETGDGCPNCGWGNNELEYYRMENAWVQDSVMTIEARNEYFANKDYTSARLKTQGKQSFIYGRIDARALLPEGKGLWPAIWTLGENISSVSWPACGEIDIMEMVGGNGNENTVYGTVHWKNANGDHAQAGQGTSLSADVYNFSEAYHVFSVIWDENFIKWYVDNQQFYQIDISGSDMSEFHNPHFLILNVAVGGNWPGSPDGTTIFPQQMKIDYIRVFQEVE